MDGRVFKKDGGGPDHGSSKRRSSISTQVKFVFLIYPFFLISHETTRDE